ncbi:hypothetical protein FHL15_009531 [Xylaria flabelliformis]|uniref:Myb-like domain-containing protein n=1 Tax=Xylaria flabelliformis TaxID=2512241 RepID=A0A553HNU2_9PEZI|nr:hypothetical protein FHL15_009531 [Xylaria flabelliformis]
MLDMRTQTPHVQPVWSLHRDCLPGESHLYSYCGGDSFAFFRGRVIDASGYRIDQNCHEPLSQRLLQQIMDNQNLYQHGIESSDDACSLNDYYPESLSMVGTGLQNFRGQTTTQPVSLANCGRDVGPGHPQYSNKAASGNEQMFFPNHPAANAYTHDWTSSFNQQQVQYSSYNPNGPCNLNSNTDFHHGLPSSSNEVYSTMPVFGESFEYSQVQDNPTALNGSFSSSTGSSIASERMASMTLESGSQQNHMPLTEFASNHHASPMDIRGQNWTGSCPATISPKMLRINPSPTPTSSSESVQVGMTATGGDSDLGASAWDQHEVHDVLPSKHSNHKTRKELPTKPTKPRLASASSSLPRESAKLKGKGKAHTRQHGHQSPLRCLTEMTPPRIIPKHHPATVDVDGPVGTVPSGSADVERDAKNRFLVESKLAGMTYREIRRQGGFTEAESTLRGRFRTLTKNKEQRVRKPEWQEKDIRLLKKAVRKLADGDKTSARVPWKQVAAYIYEHDGSYHFGNATCRKKWDELVEQGAALLP